MKMGVFGGRVALLWVLALVSADPAGSQTVRTEAVDLAEVDRVQVIQGTIRGDETVDYVLSADPSQILSVDLQSSGAAAYFNILPKGRDEALFVGSTSGSVADVPAPEAGEYVVRVYMMRSAARRNETARYTLALSLGAPEFADGLSGGPDYWQVAGVGGGEALNIRSGPSTRYGVISKARNGEVLRNRGCRRTGDTRWCAIRAVGSGQRGWVAGRFLVETAAPRAPAMPEGGPVGNGTPFDATGSLPCALAGGSRAGRCLFGVVRDGPGNAGVWIALGDGSERHLLFEGGKPVTANTDAAFSFEKEADRYLVRVGDERFEIPEAVVYGG